MVAGVDRVARPGWFWDWSKRIVDAAPPWLRMLPCILAQSILNFCIPPCSIRSHPVRRSSLCGGAEPLVLLYEPSRLMRAANCGSRAAAVRCPTDGARSEMSRKRQAKTPRAHGVFLDLGFDEVEAEPAHTLPPH